MFGTIVGDVVGSSYEGCLPPIKTKKFMWFDAKAHFTDDTVTTIAVAAALMEGKKTKCGYTDALCRQLRYWCRIYPDVGFGGYFKQWFLSDMAGPYNSYGNGAAMRVSPAAWVGESLTEVQELAELTALVSHNHPQAVKGAIAAASTVYLARTGADKEDIRAYLRQYFYPMDKTLAEIRPGYTFTSDTETSVPEALEAFLESESFADAICNAVSLGGDTDTQAAIAGAAAEAYYGVPAAVWQQSDTYLTPDLRNILHAFSRQYMKN